MKKIILAVVIGTTLAGCLPLSANEVQRYTAQCIERGGTPVVMKDTQGFVERVRCEIDGNLYMQGDY